MTRSILVLCDGARRTARDSFDSEFSVSHRGEQPDVNIAIRMPSQGLRFDDRSMDLVRIAAYAFAADQEVRRGGTTDIYGEEWVRDLTIRLPVLEPVFWSTPAVRTALESTLDFVSDDRWHFEFSQARADANYAPMLNMEPSEQLGSPTAVVLFSGGLDSLCAAVEQFAKEGRRPLLLRHAPAANLKGRQTQLRDAVRERFPAWHWPIVDCAVHRVHGDPKETTNRTRSFLYAAFGLAIARALKLPEVYLCDNGVVSLNLPINGQLVGARASRSTHPRFLADFNRLAAMLFRKHIEVVNTLWDRTRMETLHVLKDASCPELASLTNSCVRHRGKSKAQPHCGICSQCVDRRFATIDAGLEDVDFGERYEVDLFRDPLDEGEARTIATSYVAFANAVADLSPEAMFERYPQLFDCVPNDATQSRVAGALTAMIGRQGQQTLKVMSEVIAASSADLSRQRLPATSLIVLVAGRRDLPERREIEPDADRALGRLRFSADYRSVDVDGETISLTPGQARATSVFHRQFLAGDSELSQDYVLEEAELKTSSLFQLFRRSPAWKTVIVGGSRKGMYRLNVDTAQSHG